MQKTNRSSSAAFGLVFLFFSLAIVPVSLRAAGFSASFSPTLTAAIDVWREMSGFLGDGYQSAGPTTTEPAPQAQQGCERNLLASAMELVDLESAAEQGASVARSRPEDASPTASRRTTARECNRVRAEPVEKQAAPAGPAPEPVAIRHEATKVAAAAKLNIPSAELRRNLRREIARYEIDLSGVSKALGLPADGKLMLKIEPAAVVPAPPSVSRCTSSKSAAEQRFEFHFQTRRDGAPDARVLKLISTGKRIAAELLKRSA